MSKSIGSGYIEPLESRTLLSVSPVAHGTPEHHPVLSAAVQADLTTIAKDQKQLATDLKNLRPTLQADEKAVSAAINALASKLAPLRTTLQSDETKWATTLRTDEKTLFADRGNATKTAADKVQLQKDEAAAKTALQADRAAIQKIIDTDPAVIAARAKRTADLKPITADAAKLQADYTQLHKDLAAQKTSTGSTSTSSSKI